MMELSERLLLHALALLARSPRACAHACSGGPQPSMQGTASPAFLCAVGFLQTWLSDFHLICKFMPKLATHHPMYLTAKTSASYRNSPTKTGMAVQTPCHASRF